MLNSLENITKTLNHFEGTAYASWNNIGYAIASL